MKPSRSRSLAALLLVGAGQVAAEEPATIDSISDEGLLRGRSRFEVLHVHIDGKPTARIETLLPEGGFAWRIPGRFFDGEAHRATLFAIDPDAPAGHWPLPPRTFRLAPVRQPAPGDAVVRSRQDAGPTPIVLRTSERCAGAIVSLRWNGVEFIDRHDHGRELQSASNHQPLGRPWGGECFNPTEAGSRADGTGPFSTSRLLALEAEDGRLRTRVEPAFWLHPGQRGPDCPRALSPGLRSRHRIGKRVTVGLPCLPHALDYEVTFEVPADERHVYHQFEIVTGYMPAEFSRFLGYDPARRRLVPLSDGPGEQRLPVILATESGGHAMGVWSPEGGVRYGRFRFPAQRVVKWNAVARVGRRDGTVPVRSGEFRYRAFVLVGSLDDVRATMERLDEHFSRTDPGALCR